MRQAHHQVAAGSSAVSAGQRAAYALYANQAGFYDGIFRYLRPHRT